MVHVGAVEGSPPRGSLDMAARHLLQTWVHKGSTLTLVMEQLLSELCTTLSVQVCLLGQTMDPCCLAEQ